MAGEDTSLLLSSPLPEGTCYPHPLAPSGHLDGYHDARLFRPHSKKNRLQA